MFVQYSYTVKQLIHVSIFDDDNNNINNNNNTHKTNKCSLKLKVQVI